MDLAPRISNLDKNYLINGGMDFFQRSLSVTLTGSLGYVSADRFRQSKLGAWSVDPVSSRSSLTPNFLSKYSLSHVGTATDGTATSTVMQLIESNLSHELSNQPASFGMWVNSDTNGPNSVTLTAEVPPSADSWGSSSVLTTTVIPLVRGGGWQYIKWENISIPDVHFGLGIRAVFTNWVAASVGTLLTTQWTLIEGIAAGHFSRSGRNIIGEFQNCQRYFEKTYEADVAPGTVTASGPITSVSGGVSVVITFAYKVTKRVLPATQAYSQNNGASGAFYDYSAASNIAAGEYSAGVGSTTFYSAGAGGTGQTVGSHFTADAEIN